MFITATELKNNLGKYLKLIKQDDTIIVTRNGEPIAKIIPFAQDKKKALDSLAGLVEDTGVTLDDIRAERLEKQ